VANLVLLKSFSKKGMTTIYITFGKEKRKQGEEVVTTRGTKDAVREKYACMRSQVRGRG